MKKCPHCGERIRKVYERACQFCGKDVSSVWADGQEDSTPSSTQKEPADKKQGVSYITRSAWVLFLAFVVFAMFLPTPDIPTSSAPSKSDVQSDVPQDVPVLTVCEAVKHKSVGSVVRVRGEYGGSGVSGSKMIFLSDTESCEADDEYGHPGLVVVKLRSRIEENQRLYNAMPNAGRMFTLEGTITKRSGKWTIHLEGATVF